MAIRKKCPFCGKHDRVIKVGVRRLKKGQVQKYFCRRCGRHSSSSLHPFSIYPDETMIRSIDLYNRGYSVEKIISVLEEESEAIIPERTIYSWLQRYKKRFDLYLLKKSRGKESVDPIVYVHWGENGTMRYHRQKIASSCCRDNGLLNYIFNLDPEFDIHKARCHPNSRNGEEKGILDPDRRHDSYLMIRDLFFTINPKGTQGDLKEYFLLNHPDSIAADLPLNMVKSENSGNDIRWKGIDLLIRGQGGYEFLEMSTDHYIPEEVHFKFKPLLEAFRKDVGEKVLNVSVLHRDGIHTIPV